MRLIPHMKPSLDLARRFRGLPRLAWAALFLALVQLAAGEEYNKTNLLVRFDAEVQSAQRTNILNALGGATISQKYTLVPDLYLVTLPAGQQVDQVLSAYNATPGIRYAEPNYVVRVAATTPNDPRFSELWGLHNTGQTGGTPGADIRAPEAWDFNTGSREIIVAVIDTGVDYTHPDLTNNIWTNPGEIPGDGIDNDGNGYVDDVHGYDFYDKDGDPMDEDDHGTHCAGTIGAEGNNNLGVAGVCWQVRIMAVRFLGPFGGSTADAILSIQYAALMKANVMNNSWGGGGYSQALKDAIEAAGDAGIIFPAAAGNSGTDNDLIPHYPSSYDSPSIVAVMSTDDHDARSDFSCYGLTSVDLAAPGSDILSCQPGGGYQYMSGTSMATPHVSGACALLLAANPNLTVAQVKQALLSTVDPVVPGLCVSGGRLNLSRALASLEPQGPALEYFTNYVTGGNGNGIVEANECNTLDLVLSNSSMTNITGITVTLSTTNAGVAIAQPASAYPDIPPGASATNLTPFRISTAPEFVCGTPIEFSLVVRSDVGVSVLPFTLATGTPGIPIRFDNHSWVQIPALGSTNSAIVVSNIALALNKVTVSLFVEEPYDYFLKLELIAPDGTTNLLTANNGYLGENYGLACSPEALRTTFDDDALTPIGSGVPPFLGAYRPAKALAIFSGKSGTNVNGTWQLRATDSGGFSNAVIHCWSLFLTPTICADGGGQCPGADMAIGIVGQPAVAIAENNLTYSISVTNLGPSSATNVTVTHLLPPGAAFVSATASQGAWSQQGGVLTFTLGAMPTRTRASLSAVVQPADLGTNYTCYSTATVTSGQPDFVPANNSATTRNQVTPPAADLAVGIAATPNPVLVGGTLTYTVSLSNNGPSPAPPITVTNVLPPSTALQSVAVSQGTTTILGNVVLWSLTNKLAMGASATATIKVTPTAEGVIKATATADAGSFDPVAANNSASVSTAVGPAADLALSLVGLPNPVVAGSNVTYKISVSNLGPSTATDITVSDLLPPEMIALSATATQGSGAVSNHTLLWNLGTLSAGAEASITIVAATTTNGVFTSTASVLAAQADPNLTNNTASAVITVTAPFIDVVSAGATLTFESGPVNGALDSGETVTMTLRLRNAGNSSTRNLVATLLATNGIVPVPPNQPQAYGILFPSGLAVGRPFSFAANGPAGGTVSATLLIQDGTNTHPPVSFAFTLPSTQVVANTNSIIIPDPAAPNPPYEQQSGPAKPYPSIINVSNFTGTLGRVAVTLSNLNHSYPADMSVLVVAPGGGQALLMSGAGDQPTVGGVNLTFDSSAPTALPEYGQLVSGSYQPAAYGDAPSFPTNAPPGPYATALSALNSVNPNGAWSLYVYDQGSGDDGVIANGWSLTLTRINPVNHLADLALTATVSPSSALVGGALTYVYTITNGGPNTAQTVAFTNVLPAGFTLVSAGASQGTVFANPASVTVNLGNLGVGATARVTNVVAVTPTALPPGATNGTVANVATVGAFEQDLNPGNNSVSVPATIARPVANLSLAHDLAPNPVVVGYPLTNLVLITNLGPATAVSATLTQTLPAGAGFIASASSSTAGVITNAGGTITCLLGNLASNATAAVSIVLTSSTAGFLTNTLTLGSGSYDPAPANNTSTRVATVVDPAPQIINAGAVLTYESGPVNGAIDPNENITLSLALANIGTRVTGNLKATLLNSGGVTAASGPQYYPALAPGGGALARTFSFKAAPALGSGLVATLQLRDERPGITNMLPNVVFTFVAPATMNFTNAAAITIPDRGGGAPYPSVINVEGLTGRVSKATVTLKGFAHQFPHDVSVLLVSPSGTNVLLMAHTGGGYPTNNLTLTFDDSAPGYLPNWDRLASGVYRPTFYEGAVTLPGTISSQYYQHTLSALNWSHPNGPWSLYVFDDAIGDAGVIAGGWSLSLKTVVTVGNVVNLAAGLLAPATLDLGAALTNTIRITNSGPDLATGVMLTNLLPANADLLEAAPPPSFTNGNGGVVWNLGDLEPGAVAEFHTVVLPAQAGMATHIVTLGANEEDLNPADNTAQTTTAVYYAGPAILSGFYAGGHFHLTVTAQRGFQYVVQGSTNLTHWVALHTNANPAGTFTFTDTTTPALRSRFYRTLRR